MHREITSGLNRYTISYVDARTGLRLGARVANALAMGLAGGTANPQDLVARLLSDPGLGDLLDLMSTEFAKVTVVHWTDGGTQKQQPLERIFSTHFAGNYGALLEWLTAATEHNLSSFLAGASAAGSRLRAAVSQSPSPESAATSGPSGA